MEVTTIGIDLAKSVFALSGADSRGRVVIRRQLRRAQVLGFMRGLPRCVGGMEATGGAQYWARQFTALGHEVRLMSPALVMPYRKGNKTDRNDADAILEAVSRPEHAVRHGQERGAAGPARAAQSTGAIGQEPHRPVQSAARSIARARRGSAGGSGGAED